MTDDLRNERARDIDRNNKQEEEKKNGEIWSMIASENSRPSSLPARMAFRVIVNDEGPLFSQARSMRTLQELITEIPGLGKGFSTDDRKGKISILAY